MNSHPQKTHQHFFQVRGMHRHGAIGFGLPAIERALSISRIRGDHHRQFVRRTECQCASSLSSRGTRGSSSGGVYAKTIITEKRGFQNNDGIRSMIQSSFFYSSSSRHCYFPRTRISTRVLNTTNNPSSNEKSAISARLRNYRHVQQQQQQQQQQSCTFVSSAPSTISTTPAAAATTITAIKSSAASVSYIHVLLSTLQQSLLRPRSLPLPRYLTPRHYTYTLSETFGHASFVLMAISYSTSDFLQLRLLAVLGSTSMVLFTYFHPHGRVLWLPLKWNLLFVGINLYRIGKVYYYRYCASNKVSESMKKFRQEHLSTIDPIDYYKLLQLATVETFEEGTMVMQQGQANPYVRIVLEGELQVLRDGTLTYVLEEGMFVSEGGLHAGLMLRGSIESCCSIVVGPKFDPMTSTTTTVPTTTVTTMTATHNTTTKKEKRGDLILGGISGRDNEGNEQNRQQSNNNVKRQQDNDGNYNYTNGTRPIKQTNRVKCLRWNRTELVDLLESSTSSNNTVSSYSSSGVDDGGGGLLGNALRAALSWDIVRKLKSQRHMLTEGRVKDPTSWSRKREEQGIARYASILQNLLQHYTSDKDEDFRRLSEVLTKYRGIHRIDDESHEKALAKCGWSVEEFRLGKRSRMKKSKVEIGLREHDEDEDNDDDDDDEDFDYGGEKMRDGFDDKNSTTSWGRSVIRSFFQ